MGWEINLTDLVRGGRSDHAFSQSTVKIGRAADNEIVLQHHRISRLHAVLSSSGGQYYIEDSSRNGTYVRVDKSWTRVTEKTALTLPAIVRLADWVARIDYQDEDNWDKSVIIPAGALVKREETIVVFDLCESSRIASEDDHMAYHLKQRLQQIAEPVLAEFGKRFYKSTGDGFLVTFAEPRHGLRASFELEARIQHRNSRTNNIPIHYRIALHHGETWGIATSEEDIHGNDVNITFRIEGVQADRFEKLEQDLPTRDRILGSSDFIAALEQRDECDLAFVKLYCGKANLKGIADPIGIFSLTP